MPKKRLFRQISQHVCISYILAARTPILHEFTMLENRNTGKSVRIIDRVQASWKKLVPGFWLPGETTQNLLGMPNYTLEAACEEVFRMWLDGGDDLRMPRTWNTVIEVIEKILRNARLGREIRAVLNGRHMYIMLKNSLMMLFHNSPFSFTLCLLNHSL